MNIILPDKPRMITLSTTEEQRKRAEILAKKIGKLKDSITGGESTIYGAIGEIVCFDYFNQYREVAHENTYDYDLIVDGSKVDVKTKRTTEHPLPNYLCSVAEYNTKQECDYYFFARALEDLSKVYLLGYITKPEFYQKAFFAKKGDTDPEDSTFKFTADCYNIKIEELNRFTKNPNFS